MITKTKIDGRDFRLLSGPYNPFDAEESLMLARVVKDQAQAQCPVAVVAGKSDERWVYRASKGWIDRKENAKCTASK